MGIKVFKQLAGGYNVVVKKRNDDLTAFYSPYAHPHIITSKKVLEVEEAMRYFYSVVWHKRKVFYCSVSTESGERCAVKLVPTMGNGHVVRVVRDEEVYDLYEVCLLKEKLEPFLKENMHSIIEEVGIKGATELTLCFNFQTRQDLSQDRARRKELELSKRNVYNECVTQA